MKIRDPLVAKKCYDKWVKNGGKAPENLLEFLTMASELLERLVIGLFAGKGKIVATQEVIDKFPIQDGKMMLGLGSIILYCEKVWPHLYEGNAERLAAHRESVKAYVSTIKIILEKAGAFKDEAVA